MFAPPNEPVAGKTRKDQLWIDQTVEAGVRVCQWPRPVNPVVSAGARR